MAFHSDFDATQGRAAAKLDVGLRAYMLRVYNWMALALVLTGVTAYAVLNTPLFEVFFHIVERDDGYWISPTPLGMGGIFAPLAFVMVLSFGVNRLSRVAVQVIFLVFSVVMGISMACLLMRYTGTSIVRTLFITASLYAVMSLWGYVTKRSLMGWGSVLMMALIGMIIAILVNLLWPAHWLTMAISFVGVIVFTALTAYDTQRIKFSYQQYRSVLPEGELNRRSIYDALEMYLDIVGMFRFLLILTGSGSSSRK